MTHKEKCECVNCKAKGSPLREIFIKDVTAEDLSNIEILDWLEGWGQVMSLSSQKFIRKYGFLLAKLQDDPQWDATDAAHPAWWRGEKYGAWQAARLIADVISGKDTGKGVMNEPVGSMRDAILELKQERDNLNRWNDKQIETIKRYQIKRDNLQERNNNQAKTIRSYQTGNETKKLLLQIDELFTKVGLLEKEYEAAKEMYIRAQKACKKHALRGDALEKENEGCWDRVHDLEEENGRYWERIGELEAEILTLKSRSQA